MPFYEIEMVANKRIYVEAESPEDAMKHSATKYEFSSFCCDVDWEPVEAKVDGVLDKEDIEHYREHEKEAVFDAD